VKHAIAEPRRGSFAVVAAVAFAVMWPHAEGADRINPIRTVPVAQEEFMVDAGGKWSARLPDLQRRPHERVLLRLQARVDSRRHGGCNFALGVSINGRPLNQPRRRPRLLNKPERYHLRGYDRDFGWYRRTTQAWSTIFGPDFEEKSVVEGQDYTFLWDVDDLVISGRENRLTISHLLPLMPKWLGGRGKLAVRGVALVTAEAKDIDAAVRRLLQAKGAELKVHPAVNEVRRGKAGERPFELVWAGRKDVPEPVVTFDDLSDWEVVEYGGAKAALERSREQLIWGDYSGKVTFLLPNTDAFILLQPRKPVPIPGEFDCVNLWVYGGKEYFLKGSPHVPTVYVQIEDAGGETHELSLGVVNQNYWFLQHGKFAGFRWPGEYGWPTYESWGGECNGRIEFPARFRGIVIADCKLDEERTLWLDSLAFYREKRSVPELLPPPDQPKYPTTPDTILPTCKTEHENVVEKKEDAYALIYRGKDGALCYTVEPRTGTLSDVKVSWNGGKAVTPMAGGGVLFGGSTVPGPAKPAGADLRDDSLTTKWRDDRGREYVMTYRIKGKTLIVDVSVSGEDATGFTFGTARGLSKPKLIDVPYLSMEPVKGPCVLHANGLFILGLLDWYNTNASKFDGTASLVSEAEAAFNGGAKYLPRTDGRRNPLRERVFLTVSPDFHEVLPNIPNPPSPRLKWASDYVYCMVNPPLRPKFLRLLSRYGVDHLFAICWGRLWIKRQGDSYTYRVRPIPGVSYEDVAEYARKVRSYGDVFGLGVGARDFCPLSKRWDENLVALEPDGNWRRGWPSNYVINHAAARRLAREAGVELRKRYGPNMIYLDVQTHPSPWRCANDYNALISGAGMLQAAFRWNCDLMLEMRRHHDFVVSEGGHRWMYAGISEGDYATIPSRTPPYKRPLLVDFDLLKIHPLQHGVGMGYGPTAFYPWRGMHAEEARKHWKKEGINRYVAATVAYGHMGCLSNCAGWPLAWTIRYFALVWPLQREYLTDTVAKIRYHDGRRFVPPSEAAARDVYLQGRVYVRYRRGLEIVVNYNETENWEVELAGRSYVLPPFGFAACLRGKILSYAALEQDRRVEYVESPDLIFANSPGRTTEFGTVSVHGAVLLRKRDDSNWWLIPSSGLANLKWKTEGQDPFFTDAAGVAMNEEEFCREVRLDAARLFKDTAPGRMRIFKCGEDGEIGAEVVAGGAVLRPTADVRRYLVQKSAAGK